MALLVAMLCSSHRTVAQSVIIDGITYHIETYNSTAYVSDAVDTITHAKVKAGIQYNGMVYPVTRIGDGAFQSMTSSLLHTVELPNTITRIEGSAFYNCGNLTSINIPSGVTSIGSSALSGAFSNWHHSCYRATPSKKSTFAGILSTSPGNESTFLGYEVNLFSRTCPPFQYKNGRKATFPGCYIT